MGYDEKKAITENYYRLNRIENREIDNRKKFECLSAKIEALETKATNFKQLLESRSERHEEEITNMIEKLNELSQSLIKRDKKEKRRIASAKKAVALNGRWEGMDF